MLTLFSGQSGPIAHVSRILGAAAKVSEAAGDAASSVVLKGTAMSSAVSTAVVDITTTSLGAVQTAWHGVDLVALTVHKISGTVTAETSQQVVAWLNSSSGQQLTTVADELTMATWVLMLQDVSSAMPHMQRSYECLVLNGTFLRVSGEVQVTAHGQTILFYEISRASFQPRWANPMWSMLEFSHEAEHGQVLQTLQSILQAAPSSNRTITQLGQPRTFRTAALWMLGQAFMAARDWEVSANSNGNLWGSGILLIWWISTKMSKPVIAAAAEQQPEQQAPPAAASTAATAMDESRVSEASASSSGTGLFECVGSM
jgi:hypothetical protein